MRALLERRPDPLLGVAFLALLLAVIALGFVASSLDGPGTPGSPPASVQPSATTGSTSTPSTAPTPSPTPSPTSIATPSPSPPTVDPAQVTLALEQVAAIPGRALDITNAGDGSGRLFVADQTGKVWIVRDGIVADEPFLDIADRVSCCGERGLLGIAFHPDYPSDPRLFVNYTDRNGNTVVAAFRVPAATPDRADPASESVVLAFEQPFANHNGGGLAFSRDGLLHISTGDGGAGGDPLGNGQRLDTLLGKILRIDVDRTEPGRGYAIPPSNPFVGQRGARDEIWLTGLRNPWRIRFDRATDDLWIGDVGQGRWEEVDVNRSVAGGGANFGWNRLEGDHCFPGGQGCDRSGLTPPVAEYDHSGERCSVIGGVVYRGPGSPILHGLYLFADACTGELFAIDAGRGGTQVPAVVGGTNGGIAGFGEGEDGEAYAVNVESGAVYRLVGSAR